MTDLSNEIAESELDQLIADQLLIDNRITAWLVANPSLRLSHHHRGEVYHSLLAEKSRRAEERGKAEARAEREARNAADQEQRKYDTFTREQAERLGITPQAFLDLQAERRGQMAVAAEKEAERKANT